MENEKSTAEKTQLFSKAPGMSVIKGGYTDQIYLPRRSLYTELRKFTRLKENVTFLLQPPLDNLFNRIIKRSFDLILSTMIIIGFLSWLIPVMAVLIKLDSKGSVFILQRRNKRGGKVFTCINFRSMSNNDDRDSQVFSNEERITKLGRVLRTHHIDKLPQFLNVWKGDMSFIGPRPYTISDNNKYEELIEFYDYRYKVKPGIIGFSTVMGYADETKHIQAIRHSVQVDIFYIRHWSIRLDLRIFWCTFLKFVNI